MKLETELKSVLGEQGQGKFGFCKSMRGVIWTDDLDIDNGGDSTGHVALADPGMTLIVGSALAVAACTTQVGVSVAAERHTSGVESIATGSTTSLLLSRASGGGIKAVFAKRIAGSTLRTNMDCIEG
ncbi:hypothetical protein KC19_VG153800 [Ceratodon purpureus]|nr:hypothetical protein KC19_VG153800 [Ceratodon purpureus]